MKRIGMAGIVLCAVSSVSSGDKPPRPQPKLDHSPVPLVHVAHWKALTASSLAADTVAARIRAQYHAAIRSCYRTQLRLTPDAKGKLVLAFQVTARGATAAVRVSSSSDARIDACVAGPAATWTFPVPKNPAGAPVAASFEVSFTLEPLKEEDEPTREELDEAERIAYRMSGEPEPKPSSAPGSQLGPDSTGAGGGTRVGIGGSSRSTKPPPPDAGVTVTNKRATRASHLSADYVAGRISDQHFRLIQECYSRRLVQDPTARGKVALSFDIGETGRVERPKARGFEASLDRCIEKEMARWTYPVPRDGARKPTTASYEIEVELVPVPRP